VFDLGTGSGILAIAAAKLGAGRVVACDTDPIACETAGRNVEANAVLDRVSVVDAEAGWKSGPYDLIVANLTAEDLCALMPQIAAALAPSGKAILSGILTSRESVVNDAIEQAGLRVIQRRQQGEWAALQVGTRR
jgi:ribosomal protein L11 methyltransferase